MNNKKKDDDISIEEMQKKNIEYQYKANKHNEKIYTIQMIIIYFVLFIIAMFFFAFIDAVLGRILEKILPIIILVVVVFFIKKNSKK